MKSIIQLSGYCLVLLACFVSPVQSQTSVVRGDLDSGGTVKMADGILALKVLAGHELTGVIVNLQTTIGKEMRIAPEDAVYILQVVGGIRDMETNYAPVVSDTDIEGLEDQSGGLQGILPTTDQNADPLNYTILSNPVYGTLELNPDGSFLYTPDLNYHGDDSFTFKADDGKLESNTGTVSISITSVNDAPTGVNDTCAATEDTPLAGDSVLVNDTDPENDSLTAVLVSNPAKGAVDLNPDGTFTYTPDQDAAGEDSFAYKPKDAQDGGIATVTINITPVNDAPEFTIGANQSEVSTSGAHTVPGWATGINAGAANESGQALTFNVTPSGDSIFSVPPAIDPATGNLTYTLNGNVGTASVSVTLSDNGGTANGGVDTSSVQTFTIEATAPANQPPTAVNLTNATNSLPENTDTTNPINLADVVIMDDGQGTNNVSLSGPDAGLFEVVGGKFRLKAGVSLDHETQSSYSVTVNVDDPAVGVNPDVSTNYTLTVTNVNESPTDITPDTESANENIPIGTTVITLGAVDPDAGDTHTFTIDDTTNFEVVNGNEIRTKVNLDHEAQDTYTINVTCTDSAGNPITQPVTFNVNDLNENPYISGAPNTFVLGTQEDTPRNYNIASDFDDPEGSGDIVNYIISDVSPAGSASVDASGQITINPPANYTGDITFKVRAVDTAGLESGDINYTFPITAVNDAPEQTDVIAPVGGLGNGASTLIDTITITDVDTNAAHDLSGVTDAYMANKIQVSSTTGDISSTNISFTITGDDSSKTIEVYLTANRPAIGLPSPPAPAATVTVNFGVDTPEGIEDDGGLTDSGYTAPASKTYNVFR